MYAPKLDVPLATPKERPSELSKYCILQHYGSMHHTAPLRTAPKQTSGQACWALVFRPGITPWLHRELHLETPNHFPECWLPLFLQAICWQSRMLNTIVLTSFCHARSPNTVLLQPFGTPEHWITLFLQAPGALEHWMEIPTEVTNKSNPKT